ncbi:MAG: retroviral-like aspartic protease [Deltaproteobacteria bacterium]|nr:retroviral-like aspartic protease [Deltaproteobacteria bacterium]MBK7070388.1 retroviral-like aspartic protease [Deltaproteobacteria bacterium]MBK8696609.1 retroviral-like aspartic protease [Deltaproteobacteria bacterium]MBP6834435.1 retroviral-like aspartic protease [Deltaproteobacteria bacterium]
MRGLDLPYVDVNLLIDTGASTSFVERHVVEALGIASIRRQVVTLADHKSVECLVYRATIDFPLQDADDHSPKMMPVGITIAATPNSTHELPHHGLLGRDFLSHFTMVYAGSSGRFDLHVSGALPRDR